MFLVFAKKEVVVNVYQEKMENQIDVNVALVSLDRSAIKVDGFFAIFGNRFNKTFRRILVLKAILNIFLTCKVL